MGSEKPVAECKVVRVFGATIKAEEPNWCDVCQKSSKLEAPVYLLVSPTGSKMGGVTSRGKVTWCKQGQDYTYTTPEGEITEQKPHKQVEYQ